MTQIQAIYSDPMTIPMPDGRLYVGGKWEEGTGAPITSYFPADGRVNCRFSGASRADGERAIARAVVAQACPHWRGLKSFERARHLTRIAEGIDAQKDYLAMLQSRDTGKTHQEAIGLVASAINTFRYFAAVLETMEDRLPPARGDYMTFSIHEPLGLVAAITPWNSPIASDAQKIAPALAGGNAVLLKPASWSPLVSLALAAIIDQTDLPKGLFSVLPGAGAEIGDLLVTHPAIRRISFTGGTKTGRDLAQKAASRFCPTGLELGGKSPTIVFHDADIEQAAAGIAYGVFSSTGQSCIAGTRLFVERPIYTHFMARLLEITRALKMGHPFDPATRIAPMIHPDHRAQVAKMVDEARQSGAEILCGGAVPTGSAYENGAYYPPTIITGLPYDAPLCREEIFGPVLAVFPFDDEKDMIIKANDNDYGLACGIWTRNFPRAWRVARAITTGTVWINTYKQLSVAAPFGGEKQSGMGREKGIEGILPYMAQKSIYVDLGERPLPWSAPA